MPLPQKRLRIIAGPNGSGKSTIVKELARSYYTGPFINADDIQKILEDHQVIDLRSYCGMELKNEAFNDFLKSPNGKSWVLKASRDGSEISVNLQNNKILLSNKNKKLVYDAAIVADFLRTHLLNEGQSFMFETVLSHASKVSFLESAFINGFKNYLYFICTVDPQINVDRVKQRVLENGHDVPHEKIIKRYYDSLELLSELVPYCRRVFLFDNSQVDTPLNPIAEIGLDKKLKLYKTEIPWWVNQYLIQKLYL